MSFSNVDSHGPKNGKMLPSFQVFLKVTFLLLGTTPVTVFFLGIASTMFYVCVSKC
jgi:hypothetical protein